MRHRKKLRKLGRTSSHRRALLGALTTELLRHKRITTTIVKAKETRLVVEKVITRAKNAIAKTDAPAVALHARREVGKLIKDRTVIKELFSAIVEKIGTRPGGYTRIVKLGQRQGDGAEMAVIELVDFNTGQDQTEKQAPAAKEKKPATPKKAAVPKKAKTAAGKSKSKKKDADEDSTTRESR